MKVKLLKDLPGCKAGTYGRQSDNSFFWEFARPNGYTEKLFYEFSISRIEANPDFFEILPEPKFKVGDWAWDEEDKIPVKIVAAMEPGVGQNGSVATSEYVNTHPHVFKRLATEEEIRAVTEKEWEEMTITHDSVIFHNDIYEMTVSEMKEAIAIADKLLPRD